MEPIGSASTCGTKITGFNGIATGYVVYITGCNQVLVAPPAKDGEHREGHWVDVARLDVVGSGVPYPMTEDEVANESPGFDQAPPVR